MEGTQLYAIMLGIKFPWKVNRGQVDMASNHIDVWVEEAGGTEFSCAVCKQEAPVYYHPDEQVSRHLQDHNILGVPTLNPEAAIL
jgi:transposase